MHLLLVVSKVKDEFTRLATMLQVQKRKIAKQIVQPFINSCFAIIAVNSSCQDVVSQQMSKTFLIFMKTTVIVLARQEQ